MNTLERFYICDIIKLDNQINDKHTVKPNIIFYMIIKKKKTPTEGIYCYKCLTPAVTLFSHKQQHNKHARIHLASQHQKQIVSTQSLIQQIKIKTIRNTYHFRTIITVKILQCTSLMITKIPFDKKKLQSETKKHLQSPPVISINTGKEKAKITGI